VNPTLANHALALLARLFRHGAITYHGAFVNVGSSRVQPIAVDRWCGGNCGGAARWSRSGELHPEPVSACLSGKPTIAHIRTGISSGTATERQARPQPARGLGPSSSQSPSLPRFLDGRTLLRRCCRCCFFDNGFLVGGCGFRSLRSLLRPPSSQSFWMAFLQPLRASVWPSFFPSGLRWRLRFSPDLGPPTLLGFLHPASSRSGELLRLRGVAPASQRPGRGDWVAWLGLQQSEPQCASSGFESNKGGF